MTRTSIPLVAAAMALFHAPLCSLAAVDEVGEPVPEPPVPKIPEVASQEEFDALKPIEFFDGWDVRLAIAPGNAVKEPAKPDAAPDFLSTPWRILYVDLRRTKKGAEFPRIGEIRDGEPIGPFTYKLDFDREGIFDRGLHEIMKMEMMDMLHERSDHHLFAATIPHAVKGGYRVRIYPKLPEGKRREAGVRKDHVAEVIWQLDAPIPMAWTEFAKNVYVDLPNLGIPIPDEMTVPFIPSMPRFEGIQSLLGNRLEDAVKKAVGPTPIPGMIPPEPDPGFTIALAGAGIAINLENPGRTEIECFLARWWVDGKPVSLTFDELPARKLEEEMMDRTAQLRELTFTTRIPFRTPAALKGAGVDSKITLQLLYSPTGTEQLPNPESDMMEELMRAHDMPVPNTIRLSNRLEFRLGDVIDR